MMRKPLFLLFLLSLVPGLAATAPASPRVMLGIDVLAADQFRALRGGKVGLLTHQAGVDRHGRRTLEVLHAAPGVDLVALFAPEHGIDGRAKANVRVEDRREPVTGLPVYSLYGATRRPTAEMLEGLDVLVVDLQDLGVRSYTYISAMRYFMEEGFRHGKRVVILDRPNPLGGQKVSGPIMEKRWQSYVGAYPVPYVYGLTIGELARMAAASPGWLEVEEKTRRQGKLTVIPLRGWTREMTWPDTGLRWIAPSPAIPDESAAIGYAMTGLGAQLGGWRHGYGTRYPFRLLTYRGKSPEEVAAVLNDLRLPGLRFRPLTYREGDDVVRGAYVELTSYARLDPTALSFEMMRLAAAWSPRNPFAEASGNAAGLFNKHTGSTPLWNALVDEGAAVDIERFRHQWDREARAFHRQSRPFWLYE